MFNLIPLKGALYAGLTAIVLGGSWYILDSLHFGVISDYKHQVAKQKQIITAQEVTINNLSVQIVELIENNKVNGFESYFNGYAEHNDTISEELIF